eukprot:Skav225318  [mRNA]  locus=scaffold891:121084:124145:- [translate_table: standard]
MFGWRVSDGCAKAMEQQERQEDEEEQQEPQGEDAPDAPEEEIGSHDDSEAHTRGQKGGEIPQGSDQEGGVCREGKACQQSSLGRNAIPQMKVMQRKHATENNACVEERLFLSQ